MNQAAGESFKFVTTADSAAGATPSEEPLRYSYLHPWSWSDEAWRRLVEAAVSAGVAACQLHGLGKPMAPSIYDYQGLLFRAQRDGAVVRRQIFWDQPAEAARSPGASVSFGSMSASPEAAVNYPWRLFLDDLAP